MAALKTVQFTVNAKPVTAAVEPRLQLAEFLREHLALTGTHRGCEHGVCGACTLEIDGAPARSCIVYAVACEGAAVRTIEGYAGDPVMAALREAFSAEHALQCGYCTPGMLVTARDIVLRLPTADEARIRKELAGNLCRCTGYVGIVRAIQSVLANGKSYSPAFPSSPALLPGGEGSLVLPANPGVAEGSFVPPSSPTRGEGSLLPPSPSGRGIEGEGSVVHSVVHKLTDQATPSERTRPQTTLHQSFTVDHPRAQVWDFFGDLSAVTTCLPGTSLRSPPQDDHVETTIRIKVGPIVAEFEGAADVVRNPSDCTGMIHGSARDKRSNSTTHGEIHYALSEAKNGAATQVDVEVGFTLTGALAQFSRTSIVQDIARRMTVTFAENLEARLGPRVGGVSVDRANGTPPAELDAGSLLFSALWERIKAFLRSLGGNRKSD